MLRNFVNNKRICASEQTTQKEKRTEDISRERGIEAQLSATAQRAYRDQEDATDHMVAPQDLDVHLSVRVLELQNRDLWLRPTDMPSHFPILMTIREESFKNYRSRTDKKWKVKENKAEEFKKQKMQKNDDQGPGHPLLGDNGVRTKTRGRPDWQPSADSNSAEQRERSEWRSSGSWQSPISRQ